MSKPARLTPEEKLENKRKHNRNYARRHPDKMKARAKEYYWKKKLLRGETEPSKRGRKPIIRTPEELEEMRLARNKKALDKYYSKSKKERKEIYNKKYNKNRDKIRENQKKYYQKNISKLKKKALDYYYENKSKRRDVIRKYENLHRDKIRDYSRKWRNENPDRIAEYRKREKERKECKDAEAQD